MKYIQQITDYHEAKGLDGADLKSAVDSDAWRVREYVSQQGLDPKSFITEDDCLSVIFTWTDTEEGHDYWSERCGLQ